MNVAFVIQIIALVCLVCAALGITPSKISIGWAGMALWLFSLMLGGFALHQVS